MPIPKNLFEDELEKIAAGGGRDDRSGHGSEDVDSVACEGLGQNEADSRL